ncbi:tRNA(Met) cytidine acetyltransferase TmcA [Sediminicurvatus halobius]|uniref:tRNA(Met) cytidine acetyltransferase TmcA n=1 Tax=Sediminicurvatus halobius TaxID=2182432 RepID=A0A2U2N4I0_9GAMM|nr:GNAT family N-acetyltransferase [Spiribacter halobius]PWG63869.1 hypothetical protein DEM34_06600 [Spiribacter halobius]UEX76272.1 GNAT family N-acetyltransferase [Spiribacter halobius]
MAARQDWPPGERRLLWIEGEAEACREDARACLHGLDPAQVLWIGSPAPDGVASLRPGHGNRALGGDLTAAVLDAHSGLDPDDLGALGGALRGDGALLLLTPPADDWPATADPALERLASHGCPPRRFQGRFLTRLIRLLASHPAVRRCPVGEVALPSWRPTASAHDPECLTDDQADAVADILVHARAATPTPLLLTADRGRGKSAALGIAARRLLAAGTPVTVTAPSRRAAAALFRQAAPREPAFMPPEAPPPETGVLLVDEAAALPLPRLQALLEGRPRAVLATTIHGYEGTGRGVALRLLEHLTHRFPGSGQRHMEAPVRWRVGDPLEAFVSEALLLDAEPAALPTGGSRPSAVHSVDGGALGADEARLRAAFGLLVAGHYQTRPRDLRQLLDDPEVRLWLALEQDQVTGVLAARPEGGFAADLTREIWLGRRRPAGHLMAQSLGFHAGVADAPRHRGLRILRIAVHPARRRCGLGCRLVAAARDQARRDGLDWLGASFGATPSLLRFWREAGLEPVRVGNRADAASGSHAVMVLQPLSTAGEALYHESRERLARHFPSQRRHALKAMSPALAAAVVAGLPTPASGAAIDARDLYAFAHGHRSLLDTHAALTAVSGWDPWRDTLRERDRILLEAAVEHPADLPAIARRTGLRGRREALQRLRALVAQGPLAGTDGADTGGGA